MGYYEKDRLAGVAGGVRVAAETKAVRDFAAGEARVCFAGFEVVGTTACVGPRTVMLRCADD